MRFCSPVNSASSGSQTQLSLQILQLRIRRAAALRHKSRWWCAASHDSVFASALNTDRAAYVNIANKAAVARDINVTSSAEQASSHTLAGSPQSAQPQKDSFKSGQKQGTHKKGPAGGAAPPRQNFHRKPPSKQSKKARIQQHLAEGPSDKTISTLLSQTAHIDLLVSKLENSLKRKDSAACHQVVQQLQLLAEYMPADQLIAGVPHSMLKAWWQKLNQITKLHLLQNLGLQSNSSSTRPAHVDGQHHPSRLTALNGKQLHAALLQLVQELKPAQRIDLFLHRHHPKLLHLWLATGHQDWAQHYITMLPPVLASATYNSFVASCAEHHSIKALATALEAQQASGLPLTHFAARAAIAVYDKEGDLKGVMRVFERAVCSTEANADIYCDVMASCFASRNFKLAFDIYGRLKKSGLELTLHSYHTALRGSAHLGAQGLQELYAQMRDRQDLQLKDKTFAYVFRGAANCGAAVPASWVIQVLTDMDSYSVKMNSHIFTAFLQAATTVPLTPDQVEAVFGAMANYRACEPATAFVYTALLTFCAKQAPDRALDVWHAMHEDHVLLSSHLFSSMFAACAAAGTQEMLEAADRSHMDMEGLWNKICGKGKTLTEERDMLKAHNALLHVYASHGQVEKAKQLFASMQERGPAVDSVSASTLVAAYAKVADHEAALKVFRDLKGAGLQPTAQCYTSLLAACSRAGDLRAARRVFKSMHMQPSVEAYTALMDACLKKGSPSALDEAFQVFEEMKSVRNLKPTATTYGCLLKVCELRRDVDMAFKLYEEAFDKGVLATDECHNMLIDVCSDAGRVDEAIELVKALASKHGAMKQATLNSLIRSLADVAQVGRALRLLSIMLNMGLKPYRSTLNALIAGCARGSNSIEAARLYWGLREQGAEASKAAGSELIISLCKAGDRMEALKVYEDMTSPLPTHPQHKPHPSTKKGLRKSAAKQQHAKQQQQEADAATAVSSASTAVEQGPAVLRAEQAVLARSYSQPDTAQPEPLGVSHETAHSIAQGQHTAQDVPGASAPGAKSVRSAANDAGRTSEPTDAHAPSTPASFATEVSGAKSGTHPDMSRESGQRDSQATGSEHSSSHSRKLSIAEAATLESSNGTAGAAEPAAEILMSKPGRRPQPDTAKAAASVVSTQASGAAQHHTSVDSLSDSTQGEASYRMSGSTQDLNGDPHDTDGVDLGSSGARGRAGRGAAQAESSLGNRPVVPLSSDSSGHGRLVSGFKLSQKAICFPSIGATAALVHAFAIADDIHHCFRFYQQLQRDKKALPGLTQSHRRMWEEAIEAACRAGHTEWALQVFDDWKACSMSLMFLQPGDPASSVKFPQLSRVTLAFLENCCRGSAQHQWRVFDVCAVMRQQKERKREAALARPAKKSHHVADDIDMGNCLD